MCTKWNYNQTLVKIGLTLLLSMAWLFFPTTTWADEAPFQLHTDRNPQAVQPATAPSPEEAAVQDTVEAVAAEAMITEATTEAIAEALDEVPAASAQEEAVAFQPPAP